MFSVYGWLDHVLPDSTIYYSSSELRVVTDIDLRPDKNFEVVMDYLDRIPSEESLHLQSGYELWLCMAEGNPSQSLSKETPLAMRWINHLEHTVTPNLPPRVGTSPLDTDQDPEYEGETVHCYKKYLPLIS